MSPPTGSASRKGIVEMLPLALACVPWGILAGALAVQAGLNVWQAQFMSALVFAGAAQLSALTMLLSGAGVGSILGSTFVISSRHLLYSLQFRQYTSRMNLPKRVLTAFVLTDEMFAVSETDTRQRGYFSESYALASGFCFWVIWNVASYAGIVAGGAIGNLDDYGLDFAIAATFIAMTFDQIRRVPVLAAIVVSGVTAVLLKPYMSEGYIVVAALLGMACAYVLDQSTSEGPTEGPVS